MTVWLGPIGKTEQVWGRGVVGAAIYSIILRLVGGPKVEGSSEKRA